MDEQDQIISIMKINGPLLPTLVAKQLHSSILIASVHLSTLSDQGRVKISHLKVGGSPLYYLPEHREKLQDYISSFNPQDQQTIKLIKDKQVVRERDLDLLTRVSLRNITDFAIPLNVTINENKEMFWKWYLIEDEQALEIIKSAVNQPVPIKENKPLENKTEIIAQPEHQERLSTDKTLEITKKPKKVVAKPKSKKKESINIEDDFLSQLNRFFRENEIILETQEILRKNAEINLILKVNSAIGEITYFCKAKNKKSCDEKDLSAAYMESQTKKLPLLLIYTSGLTKKAQEMVDSGQFQNLIIKKLS